MITKFKKPVAASGSTIENEPIIKSDGASSDVMQWLSNDESSNVTISEDASNNLDLVVSAGNTALNGTDNTSGVLTASTYSNFKFQGANTANYGPNIELQSPDGTLLQICRVGRRDGGTSNDVYLRTGLATALKLGTNNTTALTISSDGLSSFAPATNTAGINVTTAGDPAYGVKIDSAGAGITNPSLWVYNNGASTGPLAFLEQDHTSGTGDVLKIQNDGSGRSIYVEGGGIVEQGGVLKENLLTNSGFDVWSNSTLEDVTGTNLVTGWTNGSGGDAYETFTTSSENITSAINSSGNAIAYFDISGLTTGKLYEISLTLTLNSGTGPALGTASAVASGAQQVGPQFVAGANSWVWEQGDDDNYIWLKSGLDTSAVGNWSAASVTLKEKVPGCVAADTLGPDGWYKTGTSDMWRMHNDGGTYTKDGSFYAAKVTTTASWAGLNWPVTSTLWDSDEWTQRFAGRTVTYGAWLKTSVASFARLIINDSGSQTVSTNHTGGGAWEWIEVTATIGASPTSVLFQVGDTSPTGTYYISQPMLVFGSAIGSGNYSRPMGEIVMFEKLVNSTGYFTTGFSDVSGTLNVEADSNGCVPKGANGLFLDLGAQDSGSAGTDTFFRCGASASLGFVYANTYGLANDALLRNSTALCKCDSNGDIEARVEASGSGTFDAYLQYAGVQLR